MLFPFTEEGGEGGREKKGEEGGGREGDITLSVLGELGDGDELLSAEVSD